MENKGSTLGAIVQSLRSRNGWTLKEMSEKIGIPVSTLSKVEHDRLTLTYDKLQLISERLNIRMSELFVEADNEASNVVLGRRSIGRIDQAIRINTKNYDYYYLCAELRQKRMIPNIFQIRTKSIKSFGPLIRHSGEEFTYVISGQVVVHTEFYDPVVLNVGESIYIDSGMGHAYLVGEGCAEALAVAVMSSADEDLMTAIMDHHNDGSTV